MDTAFIFPGQASQFVGMAKDLIEHFPEAAERFAQANNIMEMDLQSVCSEGPEETLKQTHITQPAIYVHSAVVTELLDKKGLKPSAVAGHSLGEYSALFAAGAFSFEDGLKLVRERGRLMHEAGNKQPGTMAALIGLSIEQVKELCAKLGEEGVIQPANFNSPGQIAISGNAETVRKALPVARDMGAKKAVELEVSGAFHSPLMEHACRGLQKALDETKISDARVPVYSNVAATALQSQSEIRNALYKQLTHSVLWQQSMEAMIESGVNRFYEIGPGRVLKGLLKRINRTVACETIGTVEDLEKIEEMV